MNKMYDFAIVGSGASGGTLAHYLTEAGADVALLEAGKAYKATEYPRNELYANTELMWHGGMDLNTTADIVMLRGKVLGGGTVINQALLDRFDDVALDDWRSETQIDFFSRQGMASHYNAVEQHLTMHQFTQDQCTRNAQLYAEGFEKMGMGWGLLRRGQSHCDGNDCITCLGGCARNSKQSTAVTFIPKAIKNGLDVHTEFHVSQIIHGKNKVTIDKDLS